MSLNIKDYSAFIFDLDGCIYSGNTVYPGSKELLQFLIQSGKQVIFLSNNSTETSHTIRNKLIDMNLPAEDAPILVATELVGQYLAETYGALRVHPVGSVELELALTSAGHQVVSLGGGEACDFIVIGRDTSFSYQKLHDCTRSLMDGVKLIAANSDMYHPGEDGDRVPETGALIAAIQAVSEIHGVKSVGKPSHYPFYKIIKQTGLSPEQCVMVGDNPYTDVQGGHSAGMHTIWISHGKTFPAEFEFQPNLTVTAIGELLEWLI